MKTYNVYEWINGHWEFCFSAETMSKDALAQSICETRCFTRFMIKLAK